MVTVKRLLVYGGSAVFAVLFLAYYFYRPLRWDRFSTKYLGDVPLTTEDINSRWSWTTFDVEQAARENAGAPYYSPEELTPWIEKPMYSFNYPGKFGKPYTVTNLSAEEKIRSKKGWDLYHFNEFVCSKIPLHRYLGDNRVKECKARKWKKPLAKTSIIVIFYNEAWCTLMRTVFSILETTPKILLKEIILVDDVSTYDNLKTELEEFVKQLKIVKIVRMKERLGIVPARMAGARASSGEVVVFLDAHCECPKGWLEPLLERIAEEPNAVVCPVLEDMPFDTFSMTFRDTRQVPIGVTNWDLGFGWGGQRNRPWNEPNDAVIKCPVMVGAMFAMRRSYFFDLGAFDEEMRFWGGEQLEISFRIWLCGGTLEIHPCSHVGHMHRKGFEYVDLSDAIAKNLRRVADVWMDEYKEQFYKRSPRAKLWATGLGEGAVCFDSGMDRLKPMILYPCHGKGGHQLLMLTRQGEMRLNAEHEYCMVPKGNGVVFDTCVYPGHGVPRKQKWKFIELEVPKTDEEPPRPRGRLRHSSGLCLENIDSSSVELKPCSDDRTQVWFFRDMPEEEGYEP